MDWVYNLGPYDEENYNCLHFFTEVWERLTGEPVAERFAGLLGGDLQARSVTRANLTTLTPLKAPESPCMAILRRPRITPHVGIYLERRILHIQPRLGVQFQPVEIAALGFKKVSYYK
jgi:hypothetical protein